MANYTFDYSQPLLYKYTINAADPLNYIPLIVFDVPNEISVGDTFNAPDPSIFNLWGQTLPVSIAGANSIREIFVYKDENLEFSVYNESGSYFTVKNIFLDNKSLIYPPSSGGHGYCHVAGIIRTPSNVAFLCLKGSINCTNDTGAYLPTDVSKGSMTFDITTNTYLGVATVTTATSNWNIVASTLLEGAKLYDPDDPFNGADDSAPNGGGGNMDYSSDEDDFPDLPTNTVADSGFVTLYAPTATQLKSLADYLWSDTFSLDSFKKLFNNPMDCILGLSLVPVNLPHGTAKEITVGNLVSTVSCDTCTTQYVYVDCGSITVSPSSFTNSYLDFSPYTQMSIYLPYIGVEPLDVDECMGATIHVRYHIDVLTGAMCCFVKVTNTNPISGSSATHVLYTYMGQCCESVPLSSDQWGNTIGAIMQAAAAIGGVVATAATGGAAAPAAAAQLTMATTATVNAATSMKPTVNHSGSLGGGGGMMAQRTPKLIMKAPNISKPTSQQNYTGYPVNQTKKLSACSGFTQVQNINLSVSGATQAELNEIENLLTKGVII